MSIKTTQSILRKDARIRIRTITYLIEEMDYAELEHFVHEPDHSLKDFVNKGSNLDVLNIDKWTDTMLIDVMDMPFYRYSMFDNYHIREK